MPPLPLKEVCNLMPIPSSPVQKSRDGIPLEGFIGDSGTMILDLHDLSHNVAVLGHPVDRLRINLRLIESLVDLGYDYLILDVFGEYKRLMNVVPSAKVFRLGIDASLPLLDPEGLPFELYSNILLDVMRYALRIRDPEYRLLYEGVQTLHQQGISRPTLKELFLALQDVESKPTLSVQEYAKIDSLYRALYPLFNGRTSAAFDYGGTEGINELFNNGLVILDLSYVTPPRFKVLAVLLVLCKALGIKHCGEQLLLLDMASEALPMNVRDECSLTILSLLDTLNMRSIAFHFSSEDLTSLSTLLLPRLGLLLIHKTALHYNIRSSIIDVGEIKDLLPNLQWNDVLLYFTSDSRILIANLSDPASLSYPIPSDEEVEEHMRRLGYEVRLLEELKLEATTLLERDFKEYAEIAYRLLKIIGEQVVTRGEAINVLKSFNMSASMASRLVDVMHMIGYIREDYVSGRRCIVLTRKAAIAVDEFERKMRMRSASSLRGGDVRGREG